MPRSYAKAMTMATEVLQCQLLDFFAPSLMAITFKSSAVACAVLYTGASLPDKENTQTSRVADDAVVDSSCYD